MTYGGDKQTVAKMRDRLIRAQRFAQDKFPHDQHHFQVWSPRVAVGSMTTEFEAMSVEFADRGERLTFVVKQTYGDAMQRLIDVARNNSRATSDPAFRLLQVLARVRTTGGSLGL